MFDGSSGLRWMPRKMAGSEMITIEESSAAIRMPSVVFDSAVHLYRSTAPWFTVARVLTMRAPLQGRFAAIYEPDVDVKVYSTRRGGGGGGSRPGAGPSAPRGCGWAGRRAGGGVVLAPPAADPSGGHPR